MASLNINDLVMAKDSEGLISAAGFKINNDMLRGVEPLMITLNGQTTNHNAEYALSKAFDNLAVPAGLLCTKQVSSASAHYADNANSNLDEVVPIGLFEKLLMMAETKINEKNHTKKNKSKTKSKSQKNKTRKI